MHTQGGGISGHRVRGAGLEGVRRDSWTREHFISQAHPDPTERALQVEATAQAEAP